MSDLASQLRTIVEYAKQLRDAGVEGEVSVGDVRFTLEPRAAEQAPTTAPGPATALDDHRTYGYPEGSALPGFVDPRKGRS